MEKSKIEEYCPHCDESFEVDGGIASIACPGCGECLVICSECINQLNCGSCENASLWTPLSKTN